MSRFATTTAYTTVTTIYTYWVNGLVGVYTDGGYAVK